MIDNLTKDDNMKKLSITCSQKLIQDGTMASFLKTKSDWFVFTTAWLPLRVTAKNLLHAGKVCDVRGTFKGRKLESLSFSSYISGRSGIMATINITGGTLNQCKSHIRDHLEHALAISPPDADKMAVILHLPSEVDFTTVQMESFSIGLWSK